MNEDLPILHVPAGPTDAQLQAERDAKHALEVREWFDHQEWIESLSEYVPPWQVRG